MIIEIERDSQPNLNERRAVVSMRLIGESSTAKDIFMKVDGPTVVDVDTAECGSGPLWFKSTLDRVGSEHFLVHWRFRRSSASHELSLPDHSFAVPGTGFIESASLKHPMLVCFDLRPLRIRIWSFHYPFGNALVLVYRQSSRAVARRGVVGVGVARSRDRRWNFSRGLTALALVASKSIEE